MQRKPIKYRQSYLLNPVTLGLVAVMGMAGLTLWSTGPSLLMRVESNRVLKSTAQKFQRHRTRYLENDAALDELHQSMRRALYAAKISDPDMEAWIEIDTQGQAHFGVIYDQQMKWPLGLASPTTTTIKQQISSKTK